MRVKEASKKCKKILTNQKKQQDLLTNYENL